MYRSYPALLIGFHGCSLSTAKALVSGQAKFTPSNNDYDWLGNGMYFWENNLERAMEYAKENLARHKSKSQPAAIGAVLDLGHCCNLLEKYHIDGLASSYELLCDALQLAGAALPQNSLGPDKLIRKLDCAVMDIHHYWNETIKSAQPYDSVRGVFQEGAEAYPGAGFKSKSHIQIAIRNPNCIKGFFWPRDLDLNYNRA